MQGVLYIGYDAGSTMHRNMYAIQFLEYNHRTKCIEYNVVTKNKLLQILPHLKIIYSRAVH